MPEFAHSVHVECGGLEPGRDYWYRFIAGGEASPIGRTRTAPARGASARPAAVRLRLLRELRARLFLGLPPSRRRAARSRAVSRRLHLRVSSAYRTGQVRAHSDGVEATDLRTYRNRHAQYKTDPDLQALHAAAPCLVTWDDHEVQNDYADDRSQTFDDPAAFLARRAAAYQAYWEHMPLPLCGEAARAGHDACSAASISAISRRFWCRRAAVPLAAGLRCGAARRRQAADRRDLPGAPRPAPLQSRHGSRRRGCTSSSAPRRRAGTCWRRQQLMAEFAERLGQRRDLVLVGRLERLPGGAATAAAADRRHPASRNPVVIGGDIHSFWANELKLDCRDPAAPVVATEFVGTSVTSQRPAAMTNSPPGLADNPHVKFLRQPPARLCQRRAAAGADGGRVPRRRRCARPGQRGIDPAALRRGGWSSKPAKPLICR